MVPISQMLVRRLPCAAGRATAGSLHARPLCTGDGSKTLGTPRENWAEVGLSVKPSSPKRRSVTPSRAKTLSAWFGAAARVTTQRNALTCSMDR